ALDGGEELLGLVDGAAEVVLAVDEQQGGSDGRHVPDGALAPQRVEVVPRVAADLALDEHRSDVAGPVHAGPVADAALAHPAGETPRPAQQPVGHEAAV